MRLWEIVRDEEAKIKQEAEITITASKTEIQKKEKETEKFSHGQIRVFKNTGEKVTIMGAAENQGEFNVIFNKSGRRRIIRKDDTVDFVNPNFK